MKLFTSSLVAIICLFLAVESFAKQPVAIDSKMKIYTLHGSWFYALEANTSNDRIPNKWHPVDNHFNSQLLRTLTKSNTPLWYQIPITIHQEDRYTIMFSNYYHGIAFYINGKMIYEIKKPLQYNPVPDKTRNIQNIPIPCGILKTGANTVSIRTTPLNTIKMLEKNLYLGNRELLNKKWLFIFIWDSAFIVICFFLSFYFLFFFMTRRRETFYIYFSKLAFFLGLWAFSYKGIYFFLFDDIHIYIILRYIGSIFCVYFSIIFITSFLQFKKSLHINIFKIIYLFFALFITLELLFTGTIFYFKTYIRNSYMLINILAIAYAYYLCVQGVRQRKYYAKILFAGIVFFSLFIFLMILGYFAIVPENSYVLEGFFTLTIFFTIALASRYTRVHIKLEKTNEDLIKLDKQKDFILARLNMYEHIVSSSHDHLAFIDTNLKMLAVNNSFLDAFSTKRVYVIHKDLQTIYGNNEFSAELQQHCAICLSGKETFFEKEQIFPTIGRRYMITTLVPYYEKDSSQISGIVLNSKDITERISFENKIVNLALEERRKIGMQLHDDISQILAGVKLKLSVLSENLKREYSVLAETSLAIEEQIERSMKATRDIAKGLFPVTIDREGLASYVDDFMQLVEKHNISLEINIDESLKIESIMTTMHLYYIILESITNSIKHSKSSKITVDFYRDNDYAVLSIKDNGIGLSGNFDENNGIGLTIIKYRTRLIGGNFTLEALPEQGVHIICRLIL